MGLENSKVVEVANELRHWSLNDLANSNKRYLFGTRLKEVFKEDICKFIKNLNLQTFTIRIENCNIYLDSFPHLTYMFFPAISFCSGDGTLDPNKNKWINKITVNKTKILSQKATTLPQFLNPTPQKFQEFVEERINYVQEILDRPCDERGITFNGQSL